MRDASVRAAALLTLVDPDRPAHVGVLLGNTPEFLNQMAAAGLGGYVLCGLNTTRRGAALAADVRKADCQVVVTDAEHLPLLDGVDLPACGCSTAPARTGRASGIRRGVVALPRGRAVGPVHADLHVRHQR